MTRKLYFDAGELAERGWYPRHIDVFVRPAKTHPFRGSLYLVSDVEDAEAEQDVLARSDEWFARDERYRRERDAREIRRNTLNARRTALYRLFDAVGVLLYVGITADLGRRFTKHRNEKPWWRDVAEKKIEWLNSRPEAEAAEAFAIVAEYPVHNKNGSDEERRHQYRHGWLVERLMGPEPHDRASEEEYEAWLGRADECEEHDVPDKSRIDWYPHPLCRKDEQLLEEYGKGGDVYDSVLPAYLLMRQVWRQRLACQRCGQGFPCAEIREMAARFSDDPQYAALWLHPKVTNLVHTPSPRASAVSVVDRAAKAGYQAREHVDTAQRNPAGAAAEPLFTALERAGLHHLSDSDHQAVRALIQGLDAATLRQVMSWLERTRTTALALRGTEQARPVRPVVRRSHF
ncbi:hypothetical protein ACFZCK_00040 [Kitasatospora purpeofusca]|uniref:hypothetical protein n=1 Tax=Kitasatospora purpeofusca TaxID=67352 RepID=UPI0036EFC4AA